MNNRDIEACVKSLLEVLENDETNSIAFDVSDWHGSEVFNLGQSLKKHGYEIDWNQKLVDGQLEKDYNNILIGRL
jgi:hypothetical protein